MTGGARIVATLATEEHAKAIAAFYRETWDAAATSESVVIAMRQASASNVADPGRYPPTALIVEGTRIIGFCGSMPQRLWDGTEERSAYWVKGLMVLPEYRNGPVGYLAVKEVIRHLPRSTILTVAPAARRLFAALGFRDLGAVPNWVRPLRPGAMVNQLDLDALGLGKLPAWIGTSVRAARRSGIAGFAGGAAGWLADGLVALARLPATHLQTDRALPSRGELDALWREARSGITASPVRDASYLVPRFEDFLDEAGQRPYRFVAARKRGRLVGVAALRKPSATSDPRLGGVRVATISDIVFPPNRTDAGLAVLGAVERAARDAGADALTCMTSHPALALLLRRQGYLRLAGNVHFFLRDVTDGGADRWPADLQSWWLARGDGESDGSF